VTLQSRANPDDRREFRACRSSYIVFGVICGGIIVLGAVTLLVNYEPSGWWLVGLPVLALAFIAFWLSRFRLVITPESVCCSNLFSRQQTIRRSEIAATGFADQTG
jgi:hypothetical protein